MKDARVSLAKEAGADEEVVAIFLAGVVLRFGFRGSPELAQPVAAIVLLSFVRMIVITSPWDGDGNINFTYVQASRLTRQAWRDMCSNRA